MLTIYLLVCFPLLWDLVYLQFDNTKSKFKLTFVSEETALELLKDIDEIKAVGMDNLSGKFLKNGATVLAKPISQICNLSVK